MAVSVGNAFYVYNQLRLNFVYMSSFIENKITWIAAHGDLIYTALDSNSIVSWRKMHKVKEYKGHEQKIIKFIVTSAFIFSLGKGGEFLIFNMKEDKAVRKLELDPSVTEVMHPSTYVNKLVFGGKGVLQIWNVIEGERVYAFDIGSEIVTQIVQSPLVNIVAIGYESGRVEVRDLLYDEVLFCF